VIYYIHNKIFIKQKIDLIKYFLGILRYAQETNKINNSHTDEQFTIPAIQKGTPALKSNTSA